VTRYLAFPLVALSLLAGWQRSAPAAGPEILSVAKIWDQGRHNAFTDLIRWHDKFYCAFREGDGHVGGDGKLRVLESADGQKWEAVALVGEAGIDLRDPKLSITPDDRLMMVAGGSVYEGRTLKGLQPRVTFSKDAREWTPPARVLTEGEWLWRVTWYGGQAYGISYHVGPLEPAEAKAAAEWTVQLFSSKDGLRFEPVAKLAIPGRPSEATVRFLPSGEMVALVRRDGGNRRGWIGRSQPPYRDWSWKETEHQIGGPNFLRLPDGALWAAGRSYPGGAKTVLARMTADGGYEPVLSFPSGGDTSYPGMVWHQGELWMSYYSSHEGKTSIYVARIKVPLEAEKIGSRLEPLVDDHLLDRWSGSARLAVQQPTPREVVLTADAPWEGNTSAYYTVFRDGDLFRMYYRGSHYHEATKEAAHREVACYAESKDGIHWTKPELGLFEFNGSKQNNIVWDHEGTHCFTPFLDANPAAKPEAKYKALTRVRGGLIALQSADGIHWKPMAEKPVITQGAFDSQNLAFWDPHLGKYREYHRAFRTVRDIMTGTSDDFLNWTDPHFLDYRQARPEHLYTNTVRPYPGAEHILIGFPTRFLPKTQQTEPTFMVSRDGTSFLRYDEAVIPTTAPANRDGNRSNYMAWGLVQLPGDPEWSVFAKEAYYTGTGSRLRRFTYRPDGLVALAAGAEGGEAVTRPVIFTGRRLVLNYRTARQGSVHVELQDAEGRPLPGFGATDCQLAAGDALAGEVTWKGGGDLAALAGQPVRLRLVLHAAQVYSLRFSP